MNIAIVVQGNICHIADIDRLYAETVKTFGKIDVVIASAGIPGFKMIDEVDEEHFDTIITNNLKGVYFTVQRAISHLNEKASIILISSVAAHYRMRTASEDIHILMQNVAAFYGVSLAMLMWSN